ncbi:MAG: tetratricopeptide repeat protein [Elusimicrobia bacterium]|nr:tetratricopeptide repeat protein [Elusimicrobiota bacterium]
METLEVLIQQAADHPRRPRGGLYRELLRSQTFLLGVDEPLPEGSEVKVSRKAQDFAAWADRDPELGGVWVPLFPARDDVGEFVRARRLRAPRGKDFVWMEHQPGEVFRLLRGVRYFAGLRLTLETDTQVPVPWTLVRSLCAGRVPDDAPELYELPVARLAIPEGVRIAYGRVDLGGREGEGKLLCLPAAGHFAAEDLRKLVRLDLGRNGVVWMVCRHFLQVLRYVQSLGGGAGGHLQDILRSLIGFEMYGEAESLCDWLARKGDETFAWVCQAAILGKTGRVRECAEFCRKAAAKYPAEVSFRVNGARALAASGQTEEARTMAAEGLKDFPGNGALAALLKELEERNE